MTSRGTISPARSREMRGYFLQAQVAPNYRSAVYGIDSSGQWKKKKKKKKKRKKRSGSESTLLPFTGDARLHCDRAFGRISTLDSTPFTAPWTTSNSSRASRLTVAQYRSWRIPAWVESVSETGKCSACPVETARFQSHRTSRFSLRSFLLYRKSRLWDFEARTMRWKLRERY